MQDAKPATSESKQAGGTARNLAFNEDTKLGEIQQSEESIFLLIVPQFQART
jgi:hypothetical protein